MDLFGHKEEISRLNDQNSRLNDENSRLRDALKDAEQQYESIIYVSNKLLDEFNAARDQLDAALAGIFDLEMQLDDAILDIQSMEILMIYKPYLIVNSKRSMGKRLPFDSPPRGEIANAKLEVKPPKREITEVNPEVEVKPHSGEIAELNSEVEVKPIKVKQPRG
nr:hypothetical protein Iba_chr03bCG6260 [Ipomoea batatas]